MDPSQPAVSASTSASMSAVTTTQLGDGHEDQQKGGGNASMSAGAGEKAGSVSEQLQQLLREVEQERDKAERAVRKYQRVANVLMMAQIVLPLLSCGITFMDEEPTPIALVILHLLWLLTVFCMALVHWSSTPLLRCTHTSEVARKAEDGWRWKTVVEKGRTEMSMV